MSDSLQFHSRVGDDGVLNLQVNLGQTEAKKEVVVTIAPAPKPMIAAEDDPRALSWHDFLERTYGSCEGMGLERPEQLPSKSAIQSNKADARAEAYHLAGLPRN